VRDWFKEQNIPFIEKNIFSSTLNEDELKNMLAKTENGTDDIISKRSKIVREKNIDFEDMTINEVIAFIQENPSVLKRPIIVDERRLQAGYNEEEIRTFIPLERKLAFMEGGSNAPLPLLKDSNRALMAGTIAPLDDPLDDDDDEDD
jgi:regulatory protein spx